VTLRPTRQERREHTRTRLMHAAAKVFARRGLQRASIDEVAETAGYTKGAFYANFKSKEELFLSGDEPIEVRARAIGLDFDRTVLADVEWQRMFFEFAVLAVRDPAFREELMTRYRALRRAISEVHERRAAELGIAPPLSFEEITLMTCAMAHGAGLERLLEPDDVPDDLYAKMLEIFAAGLRAMGQVPSRG
jgi:AcrR family transcriptional regulator